MFSLIAAIGKNRELGHSGQLLFHLKEDMRFFKETTLGHKIVMGRKTWDSLPERPLGSAPGAPLSRKLPGRTNLVISHHAIPDADLTISDLPQFIADHATSDEEIFIIGGGMVYAHFLPYAQHLYLTEVNAPAPDADTFFPDFHPTDYTREIIKKGSQDDLAYIIVKYTKK